MNRFVAVPLILAIWSVAEPGGGAAAQAAEPKLHITRSSLTPNRALIRAFAAFQAGDLATAELEYERMLRSEPSNPDALHGAAAVALRKNERERAGEFHRRALAANPRDAVALAGLTGLRGQADAAAAESRLKSMIAEQPDEPALHFALANVYAASARWREAQQSFFSAYIGDPEQPDYLFNLAVSLDHLHQGKLAREFYEKAAAAAARRPAAFSPARIAERLRELQ